MVRYYHITDTVFTTHDYPAHRPARIVARIPSELSHLMKAVSIDQPSSVRVIEAAPRDPAPHEVRIKVSLVGICATDAHILHGGFPTAKYPVRPGHEVTGLVDAIGEEVTGLRIGDRVVLDPGVPCRVCRLCREGRFNLCEDRNAVGITLEGGAADSLTVPAENCYRIASEVPPEAAVLTEPLACVVHAFDLVRPPAGVDVLIFGAGAIGMLAGFVARALSAASVSLIDLDPIRVERAKSAGFEAASSADELPHQDWGLAVDATGAIPAMRDALTRLRRGGTLLQIGVARPDATLEIKPYEIFARELTIVGSLTTRYSFPRAIALLERGAVDASLIVGMPFPVSDYAKAIYSAGQGATLKVTVAP